MSMSVDDLVASLNANHIGQEAIDLAALQVHTINLISPAPQCLSRVMAPQFSGAARADVVRASNFSLLCIFKLAQLVWKFKRD
jgi:hypothetical protein